MSEPQLTKNQHYVPQFYLRRWSQNGKQIHVFDKVLSKHFTDSIVNVASEAGFFDIPWMDERAKAEGVANQLMEEMLRVDEAEIAPVFHKIATAVGTGLTPSLAEQERRTVVKAFALQMVRTREYREHVLEYGSHMTREQLRMEAARRGLEIDVDQLDFENTDEKQYHLERILGGGFFENLCYALDGHTLIMQAVPDGHRFYTSDHPIIRSKGGVAERGSELLYPISPTVALRLCEPLRLHHLRRFHLSTRTLKPAEVNQYNEWQVKQSYRQVFSIDDNFELIEQVLTRDPEARNLDRKRVEFWDVDGGKAWSPIVRT
jgi:hypothetical protein